MNKYQHHSHARLRDNLVDPIDVIDEAHKDELDRRAASISNVWAVSRQMFEVLKESNLDADGRQTAMAFLNVLHNRFGEK